MKTSLESHEESINTRLRSYLVENAAIDEVTVWLVAEGGSDLYAAYNPVRSDLLGMIQPLDRGLISKVLLTGLPLLEREVQSTSGHDPTVDQATGRRTLAMMAAPLFADDEACGVVSCVQLDALKAEREPLDYSCLNSLQNLAKLLNEELGDTGDLPN